MIPVPSNGCVNASSLYQPPKIESVFDGAGIAESTNAADGVLAVILASPLFGSNVTVLYSLSVHSLKYTLSIRKLSLSSMFALLAINVRMYNCSHILTPVSSDIFSVTVSPSSFT